MTSTNKGTNRRNNDRAAKKAAVLNTPKRGRNHVAFLAAAAIVIGALAAAYYLTGFRSPGRAPAAAVSEGTGSFTVTPEAVSYPIDMFADGQARFFEHKVDGRTIRYFILKSSDGIFRAAFDACDVCWPAGKGYHQEGDDMVCNNCGRRFASVLVNEIQGGCNPAPLVRTEQGGKLIIRISDIAQGKSYFNL